MSNLDPRGIRNHNPGNIRKCDKNNWEGLAKEQTDNDFCIFTKPVLGIRALARVLITYQEKHGLHDIESIISRWAPSTENKTGPYIKNVACRTGFDPKKRLDMRNSDHIAPLVKAIIRHENKNQQPYDDEMIAEAIERAYRA